MQMRTNPGQIVLQRIPWQWMASLLMCCVMLSLLHRLMFLPAVGYFNGMLMFVMYRNACWNMCFDYILAILSSQCLVFSMYCINLYLILFKYSFCLHFYYNRILFTLASDGQTCCNKFTLVTLGDQDFIRVWGTLPLCQQILITGLLQQQKIIEPCHMTFVFLVI